MKTEIELLREIADEARAVWDKGWVSLEAMHLKNLLTDYIDWTTRHLTDTFDRAKSCGFCHAVDTGGELCDQCGRTL